MNTQIMNQNGFDKEVNMVRKGLCPLYGIEIVSNGRLVYKFRNAISHKEYLISGLCQECQDKIFGGD